MHRVLSLWIVVLLAFGCKKKNPEPSQENKGHLSIQTDFNYKDKPVVLGEMYSTSLQDTFSTLMLRYYISNVELVREDGWVYKEPNSYHLFALDEPSKFISSIKDIPAGRYVKIRFGLGVDSLQNNSVRYDGDLDPSNQMFCSNNYLFVRFEGRQFKNNSSRGLIVHLWEDAHYCPYEITFSQPISIQADQTLTLPIVFDLYKLFNEPNQVDLDEIFHGVWKDTYKNMPYLIRLK